jgi:hypothetical protein
MASRAVMATTREDTVASRAMEEVVRASTVVNVNRAMEEVARASTVVNVNRTMEEVARASMVVNRATEEVVRASMVASKAMEGVARANTGVRRENMAGGKSVAMATRVDLEEETFLKEAGKILL